MQVLHAGEHKYILLELETNMVLDVTRQAGFECEIEDRKRTFELDLTAAGRTAPLLLFDAADPGNLGWFSRCQFYVDGQTGTVLQTPLRVANRADHSGRVRSRMRRPRPHRGRQLQCQPVYGRLSLKCPSPPL